MNPKFKLMRSAAKSFDSELEYKTITTPLEVLNYNTTGMPSVEIIDATGVKFVFESQGLYYLAEHLRDEKYRRLFNVDQVRDSLSNRTVDRVIIDRVNKRVGHKSYVAVVRRGVVVNVRVNYVPVYYSQLVDMIEEIGMSDDLTHWHISDDEISMTVGKIKDRMPRNVVTVSGGYDGRVSLKCQRQVRTVVAGYLVTHTIETEKRRRHYANIKQFKAWVAYVLKQANEFDVQVLLAAIDSAVLARDIARAEENMLKSERFADIFGRVRDALVDIKTMSATLYDAFSVMDDLLSDESGWTVREVVRAVLDHLRTT